MERAAAGQAAIRHPSPAATPAGAPDAGEHGGTPGIAPRALSATATRAAAMNGAEERRLMSVTGRENGLLLRRTCLTLGYPPRKRRFAFWRTTPGEQR